MSFLTSTGTKCLKANGCDALRMPNLKNLLLSKSICLKVIPPKYLMKLPPLLLTHTFKILGKKNLNLYII